MERLTPNLRGTLKERTLQLVDFIDRCYSVSESKGWHEEERTPGDILALIHSEVSEALEAFRDTGSVHDVWYRADGKPEGYIIELLDAMIRIGDELGRIIEPDQAVKLLEEKMIFNAGRDYKHGGKAL